MRVFLLRTVNRQKWTMYIEKSEYLSKRLEIASNSTSNEQNSTAVTYSVWNKLKNLAIESKNEIDNAQSGVGLKGNLKLLLEKLESKIHPEESIFQQFSKVKNTDITNHHHHHHEKDQHHNHHELHQHHHEKSKTQLQMDHFNQHREKSIFQIYYPSNMGFRRAHRLTQVLMKQKIFYHQKWLTINYLLIPLTFAASVLPGPNVFLAYNLYRCYGHHQALKGCRNLLSFTQDHSRLLYKPSLEMFECLNEAEIASQQKELGEQQTQQQSQNNNQSLENNTKTFNIYEKLSHNLRIPGLNEHVQKLESLENKTF